MNSSEAEFDFNSKFVLSLLKFLEFLVFRMSLSYLCFYLDKESAFQKETNLARTQSPSRCLIYIERKETAQVQGKRFNDRPLHKYPDIF